MMSDEWISSSETLKLKAEMAKQLDAAHQKLLGVAGSSSDPKCAELAREIRKIQEFTKFLTLEGNRDAKRDDRTR